MFAAPHRPIVRAVLDRRLKRNHAPMRCSIKCFISCALLICALAPAVQNAGAAQDILRAAAVVNDEVISMLDLDMRLRLAILATGQQDNRQLRDRMTAQVIRALIDERLQAQEPK